MAFGKNRAKIEPGEVSQTTTVDHDDPANYGERIYYPGYIPQRNTYMKPVNPTMIGEEGHMGDGTVPNNVDRGDYGHGLVVDSDVWAKDHYRVPMSSAVDQIMPEEEDQKEYDPIKVTIVDKSPDEITVMSINAYIITTPAASIGGGSQQIQTGLTPIRVLGKNNRRTRAVIAVTGAVTGTPVLLTSEQSNPAYGFPLPTTAQTPMTLYTRGEAWVSGSSTTDSFTVVVMEERSVNSNPNMPVGNRGGHHDHRHGGVGRPGNSL